MPDDFKPTLAKVNAVSNNHQLDQAYKKACKLESKAKDDVSAHLLAILAHIIRVYNERSYILGSAVSDVCSENDTIVKLWSEIFEILFAGKQDVYLR
jgi:hypothetical protein